MKPWYTGALAVIAVVLAAAAARGQTRSEDCKNLVVQVHDATGMGIPNALVTFDRAWSVSTDYDGKAMMECRPMARGTVMVDVTARGFKPARLTVFPDPMLRNNDVFMERETSANTPNSTTVSARELAPDVQKKSALLQHEGATALSNGDNEEAEHRFRDALALTPSASSIYNNIGVSYLRRYKFDEAATWFEKAVQASPYDPQLLGNLGMVRWIQKRYEESYQLLDRAVLGGFDAPGAHFVVGVVSLQKAQAEKAVEQLRKTDPAKYPMRDLFLSIALHTQRKEKAASRSFESFTRSSHAPLYLAFLPRSLDGSN
jgi:hypothetical protein